MSTSGEGVRTNLLTKCVPSCFTQHGRVWVYVGKLAEPLLDAIAKVLSTLVVSIEKYSQYSKLSSGDFRRTLTPDKSSMEAHIP